MYLGSGCRNPAQVGRWAPFVRSFWRCAQETPAWFLDAGETLNRRPEHLEEVFAGLRIQGTINLKIPGARALKPWIKPDNKDAQQYPSSLGAGPSLSL